MTPAKYQFSVGDVMRLVRDCHYHPVCHFLEHTKEGRIFDPTTQQTRLHRLVHARRNGPKES